MRSLLTRTRTRSGRGTICQTLVEGEETTGSEQWSVDGSGGRKEVGMRAEFVQSERGKSCPSSSYSSAEDVLRARKEGYGVLPFTSLTARPSVAAPFYQSTPWSRS